MAKASKPTGGKAHIFSDKNFRTLIEQSNDAIQLVTPSGIVLYSSDSVVKVLGYTPKEIEGVDISPYLHPDDVPMFGKKWEKLLSKQKAQATLEYRVKHKDGSYVWVETRLTNHLETPGVEAILGNFRNVTKRKETEQQLRESEEQYRQLVDYSPNAIAVHTGGKIVYVNKAGAHLIGAKNTKEVLGQPIMQFVHPDSIETVLARLQQMLVEKKPTDLVHEKFIRLDGKVIDVEVISIPVKYQGEPAIQIVVRDITQEKQAAEQLQQSEERLSFMAASMPQKIFTADANGDVDYCNPQWLTFTGLPEEDLLGQSWDNILHPEDREDSQSRWKHSVKTGDPFAMEQRFLRHDGTYRWHISRARAMCDDEGTVLRWFGSNTDIHDIRLALEREHALEKKTIKLTEQRTQLVALNNAKDEFIALASHQLRTPATAVKQYLGMALAGYAGELTDKQTDMIALANKSNERQIRIINDLLEVARLDAGRIDLHTERTDMRALVNQVIEEQTSSIQKRQQTIQVKDDQQEALHAVVDATKVRMVLENILHNASKYSPEGKEINIELCKDKDNISIAVVDQGVGIEPGDIDKLFRKFSRLDNPLSEVVGGTGLGLYWAKRIIDMHGGDIDIESQPHQGSTFTISLLTHGPTRMGGS